MHRDFKGVWIPKALYLHRDLGWTEKILLTEIFSLQGDSGCFASNEHLADFLQSSVKTVKNLLSILKSADLIEVEGYGANRRIFVRPGLFEAADELSRNRDKLSRKSDSPSRNRDKLSRNRDTPIIRISNTERDTDSNTERGDFDLAVKPRKTKRGSQMPDDFDVTTEMVEWVKRKGLTIDVELQTEKFRNYHTAKGSVFKDWVAAWRNWMLNAVEFNRNGKPQGSTSTNIDKLAGYEAVFAKYRSEDADPDIGF